MPHIYLSALPFSPAKSIALQHIYRAFQNTLSVAIETRRSVQWPVNHQVLRGHNGIVSSVGFSPDGTRVVSGSSDKTIRIWDVVSGAPISEPLEGHTDGVYSVAFSPDGTQIVSSSHNHTVRI